jgi:DNA ligase 1
VKFAELAEAYERLEATSKRLEMRSLLAGLFKPVHPEEIPVVVYLTQGLLRPEYEGVELGIAGSLARRALTLATSVPESTIAEQVRTSGDLGLTAAELMGRRTTPRSGHALTVQETYAELDRLARTSGEGSQETKVRGLADLLGRAEPVEAKFLIRFVLGTLRMGVREMTMLDALTDAFADGSKAARAQIEQAFNLSSDLGLIAQKLASKGLPGLAEVHLEVGRPIRPMLAEREPDLAAVLKRMGGRAAFEMKYDGLRVQAHVGADRRVRLFSRRLEEIGAQFPELVEGLPHALRQVPAIVEGECVPIDPATGDIRPFQEVSRRRGRKHDLDRMREEVPVTLFVFDVLLSGEAETLHRPFGERREVLEKLVQPNELVRLAEQKVVSDLDAATRFFEEAVAAGGEGIMAKSLAEGSTYRAGARGFWWIKYKPEYTQGLGDSIDGVIVGALYGRGRRAGNFGAFLLAVYDSRRDRFESFCKVGTGFDDAQLADLTRRLRPFEVNERPSSVDTEVTPDRWITPRVVLEVRGAELSLSPLHKAAAGAVRPDTGLALRFPRFTGRIREDKGPTEATTSHELLEMYRSQVRQATPTAKDDTDS